MSIQQEVFQIDIPISGALTVSTGTLYFPVSVNAQIIDARATIATAPTGSAAIFTVKKNGVALTPNATLTVAAGANTSNALATTNVNQGTTIVLTQPSALGNWNGSAVAPQNVANLVPGDYLSVDVTQIGSTVAGSNAVISLTLIHK